MDEQTQVVIVGAGPTGLMLAGELRLAGVTPVVLERRTEPTQESRALGFSARTIEEFDQRGLLSRFGEVNTIPMGHFGGLPLDYRVVEGGSYGARGIPQAVTEGVLFKWATDLGADVRRGHEVVEVTQDEQGVDLVVSTSDGERRLRAAYVVGCDGGRSVVRRFAGIDFPGTEPTLEMWLADVVGCELRPRFAGERVPGGMVMVFPMGPEVSRVVLYERDAGLRQEQEPPTFQEVADAWQRLTGENIHGGKPVWVSWFTDASRQASEYRRGRILLAGDAAHVHLPIGGQGMSAGVQDAVNLGWKLAAEIRGQAATGLLDTYQSERHPVGARVLMNTLAQRLLYLSGSEMQSVRDVFAELLTYREVQLHLVGMVTGFDIRYDMSAGDHPLIGRRVPNQELVGEFGQNGKSSVFEQLHQGRGVLFDLEDHRVSRDTVKPWADRVNVVSATCHATGQTEDLDGVGSLLVRPDGYTAWVRGKGSGADGLADALRRWFGPPREQS